MDQSEVGESDKQSARFYSLTAAGHRYLPREQANWQRLSAAIGPVLDTANELQQTALSAAPSVERIGNAQEFELMKISVGAADLGDSVLPHDGCKVKIVEPRTRHLRVFARQFADDFRMPVGLHHDSEGGERPEGFDELPGLVERERTGVDGYPRHDAQEFVDDRPRDRPCSVAYPHSCKSRWARWWSGDSRMAAYTRRLVSTMNTVSPCSLHHTGARAVPRPARGIFLRDLICQS